MILQGDSKNEELLFSASSAAKCGLAFVLTLKKVFSERFHFKTNRNSIDSSKNRTNDF